MRLLAFAQCLALCLALAACGRPLSLGETALLTRLHNGARAGSVTFQRKSRPRLACRERLFPPARAERVTTQTICR